MRERRSLSCDSSRFIIVDYSIVICPVLAVSLASHCERCALETVDSRAMQSAAVQGEGIEPS